MKNREFHLPINIGQKEFKIKYKMYLYKMLLWTFREIIKYLVVLLLVFELSRYNKLNKSIFPKTRFS